MNNTTNATNNQQVIDKNLQTADKETSIPENKPLKRPDRRRLKRAAEKEAKKERTASRSLGKARTDTTPPELSRDQLTILQESMENLFFASPFCRKLQNKNVGCCRTVL